MSAPLRVAVLGAGTVGREVIRGLADLRGLELAGVAVRDLGRTRAAGIPPDLLTDAPAHLVAAPDTDVIVELMGGDEPARTLVAAALGAGKAVITANKHVVAHHGAALEVAARRSGAALRFEAAVGAGIPILGPLAGDLAANHILRVRGIVNGTTNHILTAMATEGSSYEDALRDAQAHGYAEADPTGDVEGHDAVNKIVILSRLAFGGWADPSAVVRRPPALRGEGAPGITGVTAAEVEGAAALGLSLRLIASAEADAAVPGSGAVAFSVVPTAVPASSAIGATSGVRNRVEIDGRPIGCVGFDGQGAGGAATSSAVLGDLLAIGRGAGSTWDGLPDARSLPVDAVRDGLDAVRAWFFVLPGSVPASATGVLADTCAPLPGATAVRTKPIGLAALRRRLLEAASDVPNVALYPVDA